MRNKARKPQKAPPTPEKQGVATSTAAETLEEAAPALSPISVTETMFHAGGYDMFQDVYRSNKTTKDQLQRIMARLDASDAESHRLKTEIAQSRTESHLLKTKIAQDTAESTARQDASEAKIALLEDGAIAMKTKILGLEKWMAKPLLMTLMDVRYKAWMNSKTGPTKPTLENALSSRKIAREIQERTNISLQTWIDLRSFLDKDPSRNDIIHQLMPAESERLSCFNFLKGDLDAKCEAAVRHMINSTE